MSATSERWEGKHRSGSSSRKEGKKEKDLAQSETGAIPAKVANGEPNKSNIKINKYINEFLSLHGQTVEDIFLLQRENCERSNISS